MNTSGTICRVHATRQSSTTSSPAFTCGEKLNKILSKALVKDGSIKHVRGGIEPEFPGREGINRRGFSLDVFESS
jgi:hypothetical protein